MIVLTREADDQRDPNLDSDYSLRQFVDGCIVGYCELNPDTGEWTVLISDDERIFCLQERLRFQLIYGYDPFRRFPTFSELTNQIKAILSTMNSGNLGEAIQQTLASLKPQIQNELEGTCSLIDPNDDANQQGNQRPVNCRIENGEIEGIFRQTLIAIQNLIREELDEILETDDRTLPRDLIFIASYAVQVILMVLPMSFAIAKVLQGAEFGISFALKFVSGQGISLASKTVVDELTDYLIEILRNYDEEMTIEDLFNAVINDQDLRDILVDIGCSRVARELAEAQNPFNNGDCSYCHPDGEKMFDAMIQELQQNCSGDAVSNAIALKNAYINLCVNGICAGFCRTTTNCANGEFCLDNPDDDQGRKSCYKPNDIVCIPPSSGGNERYCSQLLDGGKYCCAEVGRVTGHCRFSPGSCNYHG